MMSRRELSSAFFLFLTVGMALDMAVAGSLPVGALLGSKDAILDGQTPLPHTALLSGDSLEVKDGLAVVALNEGNRMVLGRETQASFQREEDAVTVSLEQGNLSLYHPQAGGTFRVKAGVVTVSPAAGSNTLAQLSLVDGLLGVTARDGTLQVEKAGTTQEVAKGKTIVIATADPRAPAPDPQGQGRRHVKHIIKFSPAVLLALGIAAEVGLVAWAIVEGTSGGGPVPVSPVQPGP